MAELRLGRILLLSDLGCSDTRHHDAPVWHAALVPSLLLILLVLAGEVLMEPAAAVLDDSWEHAGGSSAVVR